MPDEVRLNEERNIIEVRSYGEVSREDIAESIVTVRRFLETEGVNKILVDTIKQERLPGAFDMFELFSAFPPEFKVAILIRPSQATATDFLFSATP